jgi:hypothetical protein
MSRYWHHLNAANLEIIAREGPQNYRKNVSFNYFTWADISEDLTAGLFKTAEQSQSAYAHLFRQQPGLDVARSVQHNILIAACRATCGGYGASRRKTLG